MSSIFQTILWEIESVDERSQIELAQWLQNALVAKTNARVNIYIEQSQFRTVYSSHIYLTDKVFDFEIISTRAYTATPICS